MGGGLINDASLGCERRSKITGIYSVFLLFDVRVTCSCCPKDVFICGFVESRGRSEPAS